MGHDSALVLISVIWATVVVYGLILFKRWLDRDDTFERFARDRIAALEMTVKGFKADLDRLNAPLSRRANY